MSGLHLSVGCESISAEPGDGIGIMGWPASGQVPTEYGRNFRRIPQMVAEFKSESPVALHHNAMTLHFTKKIVRVPEDMKGLK